MSAPLLTPSRTDAQQWAPDILAELGYVDELAGRGLACGVEVHPITRMAIVAVQGAGRFVMVYDPLSPDTRAEIARRVAAFFHETGEFIDGDDPRDPFDFARTGIPVAADAPCSLQTRIAVELVAVAGRSPDNATFGDDGSLDQMARLYVEAAGAEAARWVGASLPWEDQRDATHAVDWIDRFWGLDDWLKAEGGGLDGVRALCDRAVALLAARGGRTDGDSRGPGGRWAGQSDASAAREGAGNPARVAGDRGSTP